MERKGGEPVNWMLAQLWGSMEVISMNSVIEHEGAGMGCLASVRTKKGW